MFPHLQIYDSRERLAVGCADLILGAGAGLARLVPRRAAVTPERILLLRLERIGDLLMTLGAIEAVRARAPGARIHLVIGSWNEALAPLVPGIDTWETLDVPWLARGQSGASRNALLRRAWSWRSSGFDLAINFEPDIRSNALLALSGAPRRVGFSSAGGGSLLTDPLEYMPSAHTAANALRVVDAALPGTSTSSTSTWARLAVTDDARREARRLLGDSIKRPIVAVHASGGRAIKQWHLDRFAEVATRLAREHGATIVLTGTSADRSLVDGVLASIPSDVAAVDLAGSIALPILAALFAEVDLVVTGDSGPMHLAAAVGAPVVALFGPSDPARYGPLTDRARVLTADLWCRPCNRVRRPPERCQHRVPDCLHAIEADSVVNAATELLVVRTRSSPDA